MSLRALLTRPIAAYLLSLALVGVFRCMPDVWQKYSRMRPFSRFLALLSRGRTVAAYRYKVIRVTARPLGKPQF